MSLQDIAALGKLLGQFLRLFTDCFRRPAGRLLLAVYVRGLLSNVQRKNGERPAVPLKAEPLAAAGRGHFREDRRSSSSRWRARRVALASAR